MDLDSLKIVAIRWDVYIAQKLLSFSGGGGDNPSEAFGIAPDFRQWKATGSIPVLADTQTHSLEREI